MMALNMTMAAQGLHPVLDLTLVGWLASDLLQAAVECFSEPAPGESRGNNGMDLHQRIMLGIQSGAAILDIEKAHPSHVQPSRLVWLT